MPDEKLKLGFDCGMFCGECGDAVALDAHGRYTCCTCGRFVGAVDRSQVRITLKPAKDSQLPLFKNGWGIFDDMPKGRK